MLRAYRFTSFLCQPTTDFPIIYPRKIRADFESLLKIFLQLVTITSGDVGEALSWLNSLDKQYNLTNDEYGMGDFIEDLKAKGYIKRMTRRKRRI